MISQAQIEPLLSPGTINEHMVSITPIVDMVTASVPTLAESHIIPRGKYEHIFVTSDIHADLRKFHYLLKKAGLVTVDDEDIDVPGIMRSIDTIDWIKPNTLLVIIGDLVDGRRNFKYSSADVNDPIGNIELLLHIYLYNLRLKARAKGSEIRFTIGNHDYHTVVYGNKTANILKDFFSLYVHGTATAYFNDGNPDTIRENRAEVLKPFYTCSPYFMLSIEDEIVFIHGGFQVEGPNAVMRNSSDELKTIQNKIDQGSLSDVDLDDEIFLTCVGITDNTCTKRTRGQSPLWTRWYAEHSSAEVCPVLSANPYKMVVVGHCPTEIASYQHYIELAKTHGGCLAGGCVLVGCIQNGPQLAFVDIGMCSSFRKTYNWESEKARQAEMLHLTHNNDVRGERFYNVITRESLISASTIPVWADIQPVAVEEPESGSGGSGPGLTVRYPSIGGYRKTRRRNKRNTKKVKGRRR
jgi:hypothetical protein